MDANKIKQGVSLILEGIGEDSNRPGLVETPDRIARMYEEIYGGLQQDASVPLSRVFEVNHSEIIIEKDITFYSMCEHHLLPFFGVVHLAYIPNQNVTGLSKLVRTVEIFSRRPQLQEHMTNQIADALDSYLDTKGVVVYVEAEHMCMSMRGVNRHGSKTITLVKKGLFEEDKYLQEFLRLIGKEQVPIEQKEKKCKKKKHKVKKHKVKKQLSI